MANKPEGEYYTGPQAGDFAEADEPFALFAAWFADAQVHEPNDANAMALASVDASGLPNVRMVLLKGVDAADYPRRGFVFYTNLESAKGVELIASGKAALCFHWKSLRRQVRVRGDVARTSDGEADAYFATRPRGSRLGAWASQQSRPLESRFALEKAVAVVTARYPIGQVPRPPYWSGFRVVPREMEFWHDRPFRLHERILFRRGPGEAWRKERLYP
jgi:pyridoxamine 5'-phosphate oxidase